MTNTCTVSIVWGFVIGLIEVPTDHQGKQLRNTITCRYIEDNCLSLS